MRRAVLASLLLLAACAAPPTPVVDDVTDVADHPPPLAAPAERHVRIGAPTGGQRITIDAENMDLAEVCAAIAKRVGAKIVVDPAVQEVVTVSLREIPWREGLAVIAKMTRCELVERPGRAFLLEQPVCFVPLHHVDVSVRTLLQLIAAFAGRQILLPPGLGGTVTVDQPGQPPEQQLQATLDAARLPYDVVWGDPVRLRPRAKIEVEPRLFELR